jgi:hypothetical protein
MDQIRLRDQRYKQLIDAIAMIFAPHLTVPGSVKTKRVKCRALLCKLATQFAESASVCKGGFPAHGDPALEIVARQQSGRALSIRGSTVRCSRSIMDNMCDGKPIACAVQLNESQRRMQVAQGT